MNVADLVAVSQSALDVLWRASWQASVLVGLVLAAQWLLRKRAAARWRYNLWAVVLLRLALPVTPSSSWSVFNLLPQRQEELPAPMVVHAEAATPLLVQPRTVAIAMEPPRAEIVRPTTRQAATVVNSESASKAAADAPPILFHETSPKPATKVQAVGEALGGAAGWSRWYLVLAGAWLAGALVLAVRIAWASIGLQLAVRRLAEVDDWNVLDVLEQATLEIGVTRRLRVLVAPIVSTPALMGVFRPKLLLPPAVLKNFNPEELRLIFLHELAHLQRNDVLANWVMTLLLVVHWFNPIVWLAVSRMRQDRELACDERVLSLPAAGELTRERRTYGLTILKLMESIPELPVARRPATAGMVGILESGQPLKRRIAMIAHFERRGRFWAMSALGSMLVIGCVALTDAVKDKPAASTSTSATSSIDGETFVGPQRVAGRDPTTMKSLTAEQRLTMLRKEAELKRFELTDAGIQLRKLASASPRDEKAVKAAEAKHLALMEEARQLDQRVKEMEGGSSLPRARSEQLGRVAAGSADPFEMQQLEAQLAQVQAEANAQRFEAQKLLSANPPQAVDAKIKEQYAKAKLAEMGVLKARMEALNAGSDSNVRWFKAAPARSEPMDEATAKLQTRLPEARFDKIPLSDVLDWFRDILDVNLVVNARALKEAGIEMSTPISVRLKDVTGEKLLGVVAEQVGGGNLVGFVAEDNTITFSTNDDLSKYVITRAYNVQDLATNAATRPAAEGIVAALESLTNVLTTNVAPDSWREAGGTVGSISTFGTTLVIQQTPTNLREVEKLLAEIRSAGGRPTLSLVNPGPAFGWDGPAKGSGGFGAKMSSGGFFSGTTKPTAAVSSVPKVPTTHPANGFGPATTQPK